jgi:poly(3-hydroxybutyrate) depolymerase
LVLLLAFACTPDVGDSDTEVDLPATRALVEPSGTCPDVSDSGRTSMTSNGEEREFYVLFPPGEATNLPVVFYWHPLGGTASMMVNYLDLQDVADENNVIIVVPEALDANPFEWNFVAGAEEAADDLALFDDLRACLSRDKGIDLSRVYATGMSAGGLWTTFLSIHRGDALASILVMSGGTGDMVSYATPAGDPFPALLVWGGPTDVFDGGMIQIEFEETTLAFSDQLRTDSHFVMLCEHDDGHDLPPDPLGMTVDWLLPHVYGVPSPWLDRAPTELQEICFLPE